MATRHPSWAGDPEHPALPHPEQYDIVRLHLDLSPESGAEPFLDLTFQRGRSVRVLRFGSPRNLVLDKEGPTTLGMVILDVSGRQLEDVGVCVDNYEDTLGRLTFVARAVEVIESREA
jgi:hypothetical protein